MSHPLKHLSVEESRALKHSRSRRNLAVLALLGAFVLAVFAFSLFHIQVETRPTQQDDMGSR